MNYDYGDNLFIFCFREINDDNQKVIPVGTKISLAKGPNKDLLR